MLILLILGNSRTCCEVCDMLWRGETVVLVEGEGRATSILVASLGKLGTFCDEGRGREGLRVSS